jgi:heat-inducible transcriptional repressor
MMWAEIKLNRRQREVLAIIIGQHISSGVPVGSRMVAEKLAGRVSSATIRNVMAELELAGFLSQPHISAGRVPTDKAYRYYVDYLLSSTRLSLETTEYIEQFLARGSGAPEDLMLRTSHVLSEVSQNIGVVLGARLEEKLLEHIRFVKLPDRRVLAVIVSQPDLIENKVIRPEEDWSQEELDRAGKFLSEEFRGWSLRTIRLEIFKRLEEMKTLCDRLLSSVGALFLSGALGDEEPGPLFVEGTAKLLAWPEFEDSRKIKELLLTFEEKAKLVRILSACLESAVPGVRILIGRENPDSEMQKCTLIVAPFHYRQRAVGALGIVGPTRMEYDRAIPTVDYIARLCSRLLSAN